jgi:DNA uptake protein ComE-like DNA-binding protein
MKKLVSRTVLAALALALGVSVALSQPQTNTTTTAAPAASAATATKLLDINMATKEQLDTFPGIGPAYSQKIINGRPYHSKTDLVHRKIMPQAKYKRIEHKIFVTQAQGS